MARPLKEKPAKRPNDDLPPYELKRQWSKYLDSMMGKPTNRHRYEILMTPEQIEFYAEKIPQDWMKLGPSAKVQAYTEAMRRSLPKLTLIQRLVIKKYYGIQKEVKNQPEIAAELGLSSHRVVSRYLERAKKRLKSLIEAELPKIIKKSLAKHPPR